MYLKYFSRSSDFKHFRPTSLPSFLSSLFSFPCSLCFYFSSFLFSILSTSGYFINSAHSRCYYSFSLHYTHYFILFSTPCNQLSVLLQGHPRGLHKHTHAHYEAGLRCRFSIPVFTWEQTTSLHGLLPFCCPPPMLA